MHRKKWIKEIIGDCIEEYGFLYEGCAREGDIRMYSFVKKDKDLCKNIDIHVKSNKVRMILMTNVYGQEPIIASNLLESNFIKSTQNYLLFRDEEEFKAVLYHFREIILKKGISALEEISKPTTEARPRKETYWHLYTEHEKLNERPNPPAMLGRIE